MAYGAPRACARCGAVVPRGKVCACRPAFEGSRYPNDTRRASRLRKAKLRADPLCQMHGCRRLATEVDHVTPLAEGGARYDWANLASLCQQHHDEKTTRDALRGKERPRG